LQQRKGSKHKGRQHKSSKSHHQLNPFAGAGGGGIAAQTGGGGVTLTGSGLSST